MKRRGGWLRGGLAVTAVAAVLAVLVAWPAVEHGMRRRNAIGQIRSLGGEVVTTGWLDGVTGMRAGPARAVFLSAGPWGPQDVALLGHLPELAQISAQRSGITDEAMAYLRPLTKLEFINFTASSVTDAGVANLTAMTSLKYLDFTRTGLTDAGAAHLGRMPWLERLQLQHTAITDKGLAHLGRIHGLRHLDLTGTNITPEGLVHLRGLEELRVLHVQEVGWSGEDVEGLQSSLPRCTISR